MTFFTDILTRLAQKEAFLGILVGHGWVWGAVVEEGTDYICIQDGHKMYFIKLVEILAVEYRPKGGD